jgi:hypothetical protein
MSGCWRKNFIATGGNAVTMSATTMPTSFGQLLTVAREKCGLSLEDAAHPGAKLFLPRCQKMTQHLPLPRTNH